MENKVLIVIPTYNEIENIEKLLKEIYKTLKGMSFGVLIVDDNSADGTKEFILDFSKNHENFYVLNRNSKLGLASAYIESFKYGMTLGYNAFIQMDSDFSHDPCYLNLIIEKLNKYDVVVGSRNVKGAEIIGWSALRTLISKGGSIYSKMILNCPIKDLTGGFNGYRKGVIDKINLDKIISKGYSFQIELKYKAIKNGASFFEFPIVFKNREFGESKMSMGIFFEALVNVLRIRLG